MNKFVELNKIREKYTCKGDLIFKTGMQYIIEHGKEQLNNEELVLQWMNQIDEKHNQADLEGKYLWITRDFEKELIKCAVDIAKINTMDIIKYIQSNWIFSEYQEIEYDRAIKLLKSVISYALQDREINVAKEDLDYIGFEDEELVFLGFEDIFFTEEEE